jgi:cobalt-zinc-cadmium efflux system membrane fusion protein
VKHTRRWIAALVSLVVIVGGGVAIVISRADDGGPAATAKGSKVKDQTIEVSAESAKRMQLEVLEVKPQDVPVLLRLTGRTGLDLERVAHVKAQYPGKIVAIGPQLGTEVRGPGSPAGQKATFLCTVESVDLGNAKNAYQKAVVQLKLDEDSLVRTKELVDRKVLAEKFLLDAQVAVTKDQADVEAARQNLFVFGINKGDLDGIVKQIAQERMAYDIYSPASGIITEKNVTRGEFADNTVNLFTIADTTTLWVWGDVYERDWPRVQVGQKMKIVLAAYPDLPLESSIDLISPQLDAATRSIRVRGRIPNADRRLLADMYGTLRVTIDEGKGSILVPTDAVVQKLENAYVFVRKSSGQDGSALFEKREVQVMTGDESRTRVTRGLSAGETVVTRGVLNLFDEMSR